ncbi:hypothetical protein H5410_052008 [Solanum commersonii]|uniref:Uncharacterized protein n=1 Tax=Solanum commersonii TaxID=4109 RepID=A0A9J5X1S4_SOLCO|nr:hypothetical protein H5410_052008 [Solanum commersonii]
MQDSALLCNGLQFLLYPAIPLHHLGACFQNNREYLFGPTIFQSHSDSLDLCLEVIIILHPLDFSIHKITFHISYTICSGARAWIAFRGAI